MKASKKQWDYFKEWMKWRVKDPEAIDAHDNVLKAVIDILVTETGQTKKTLSDTPWMETEEFSGMYPVSRAVEALRSIIENVQDEETEKLWYGQLSEMDTYFLKNYFINNFIKLPH